MYAEITFGGNPMRNLIVVMYESELRATEVRLHFLQMQKEYLVDVEDAVIATRKDNGKVKLNQMYSLTAGGALSGGFWGTLVGLIFLNPLLGLMVGAGTGAVAGALTDVGIDDNFMKTLAAKLQPSTSALFLLVRSELTDKVLGEIKGTGGTILQTSLSHEDETRLQKALNDKDATLIADDISKTDPVIEAFPHEQSKSEKKVLETV